ncbi:hypothetical protein RJ55_08627 [Drechmeria coniospora]|nr:hypothetical protein RJ55_08627 [Drechmeria coniospora]
MEDADPKRPGHNSRPRRATLLGSYLARYDSPARCRSMVAFQPGGRTLELTPALSRAPSFASSLSAKDSLATMIVYLYSSWSRLGWIVHVCESGSRLGANLQYPSPSSEMAGIRAYGAPGRTPHAWLRGVLMVLPGGSNGSHVHGKREMSWYEVERSVMDRPPVNLLDFTPVSLVARSTPPPLGRDLESAQVHRTDPCPCEENALHRRGNVRYGRPINHPMDGPDVMAHPSRCSAAWQPFDNCARYFVRI